MRPELRPGAAAGCHGQPVPRLRLRDQRERNGPWGKAIKVPGLAALNKGGAALVGSVSCAPSGGCAAGESYTDRRGHFQGFVVSQTG